MANGDGKVVISTLLDNAGLKKGLNNISGALGGLGKTVGRITAGITAAFATAAVAITKQATDAFADWEQLTGGVTTLFKNSAAKIVAYAEDAFYTAGVSANEYMETVTGFSASLISSCAGDTEKAAAVANMAMIDMADNANKMGTTIETVRTAYQGFSKQQYMLLDNLKLGYGGTKTEMERLLKDAQAFSGVKYDINNLADVYNAIHVIQEKLGIAGATAEEAEKTITGSANMTKAAWKNVLTAIAGGGDLDKAINNLVFSITKYFENIEPVVERSLVGIGELISKIAPKLVQTVAKALIKAIPSLLSSVYQMIVGTANGIYQGIIALFSGKDSTSEISVKLNSVAESADSAAKAENELAAGITSAAKAAKKSMAGFDELNTLQGNTADDSGGFSMTASNTTTVTPDGDAEGSPLAPLAKLIEGVDLTPLKESLAGLKDAFGGLVGVMSGVFSWVWEEILQPLAGWFIEDAAPASIDAVSAAFEGLSATVSVIIEAFQGCWDELQPIFQWIGDTVLVVLQDLKEIGDGIAKKWNDNKDKISQTFKNIGDVISKVWAVVGPILTWLRDALSTLAVNLPLNELQIFFDRLYAISEILAGIFNGDFSQVLNGFGAAIGAETEYGEAQVKTFASAIGIDLDAVDQWVNQAMTDIGQWFTDAWDGIVQCWEGVAAWFDETVIAPLKEFWAPIGEWFGELFGGIQQTLDDVFYNIGVIASGCWEVIEAAWDIVSTWFDENVVQPVATFFTDLWDGVSKAASGAWDGICGVFNSVASWFDTEVIQPVTKFFSDLWTGIEEAASDAWDGVVGVFEGIGEWFKGIINGIIEALNSALRWIFGGINDLLRSIKDWEIFGATPFAGLRTVNVPQIPLLAQGAVLPPNKPFMAVVGDQKHGTNVEAPLATIQEAVALVMQDFVSANMAGHEATVAVLREILEAVLGISIGDDVIGAAVQRYRSKMSVVTGGTV